MNAVDGMDREGLDDELQYHISLKVRIYVLRNTSAAIPGSR